MPWKQSDAISLEVVRPAVAVVLNAQGVNHFTRKAMFLWPDLDEVRIDARNPRTGLYCDSASNAVDCKCRSVLCAADFHLQSSPVSGLRQRLAVRVYLIGRGIKGQQVFWKRYGSFSEIKNPLWPIGRSRSGRFYPAVATATSLGLAEYRTRLPTAPSRPFR